VKYAALRKKMYTPNIQAELGFRNVEYSGKENAVSALVLLLRNDEGVGNDTEFFEPLTDILHIIVEETE
jgi:hypothetical protein